MENNQTSAAFLQEIASNGAGDEHSHYDYEEGVNNGGTSSTVFLSKLEIPKAYQFQGPNSLQGQGDDPAAILDNLVNYNSDANHEIRRGLDDPNDQFQSLIEAVVSAGARESGPNAQNTSRQSTQDGTDSLFVRSFDPNTETPSKRKFDDGKKKRARPIPQRILLRQRQIWGGPNGEGHGNDARETASPTPADTQSPEVSPARALFKQPSEEGRKHSRPAMSTVYLELELDAPEFVEVQDAAKKYMLDESHPEREGAVGTRGKGDSDLIKLKMFECAKIFLEDEGWGDRFWGPNARGINNPQRVLHWPTTKNELISAVTPLLRRQITNERQRKYALEARKNKKSPQKNNLGEGPMGSPGESMPGPGNRRSVNPSPFGIDTPVDPNLNQYHYKVGHLVPPENREGSLFADAAGPTYLHSGATMLESDIKIHVNILHHDRRIKPKLLLSPYTCPGFSSLVYHVRSMLADGRYQPTSIKLLSPDGMIAVNDDDTWNELIASIKQYEWMEGDVRCVVQVDDHQL
ncbi:hypothetical protein EG329_009745 [Mollisiaceae sp. DMI_Dod_QoI]|nr:hypothetical protein EG329_009745 [Helotiales sp. DMI_Dod_QoI]